MVATACVYVYRNIKSFFRLIGCVWCARARDSVIDVCVSFSSIVPGTVSSSSSSARDGGDVVGTVRRRRRLRCGPW